MSADDAVRADPARAGRDVVRDSANVQVRPLAASVRKLHRGHFAFMRAVVQGLDTKASWNRYLRVEGEHDDLRNVRKTIAWIRDAFAAASRRHDRHGIARLVKIDVSTIIDPPSAMPSLDDFVAERGLADFSEAEQLAAFEEAFGSATHRQSRRARLLAKQLDALRWLEDLVAEPPQAGDALAAWLHPDLATRLEAAGVFTVRALVERINGLGKRWFSGIRAIGEAKAERTMDWLRVHKASIGLAIGAHVQVKRSKLYTHELARVVPRATAIVPLEKFIVPAELDGSTGLYRAPQRLCLMRATNDYEAILTWLQSRHGVSPAQKAALKRQRGIDPTAPEGPLEWLNYLSHTQRAYRKEVERFLLWAIVQHGKPLSSMTLEDCDAYRRFLADPAPADRWCGPRAREKWSPLWRPFEGPLSPRAQRQAVTILKSLYEFLIGKNYLIGNPWAGVMVPKASTRIDSGRSFTQAQWQFIEQQRDQLPDTSAHDRLRFALHFVYATGLRLAEAVSATVDHLNWVSYPTPDDDGLPVEGWELTVLGKGGKERIVPVPLDVIGELSHYLVARGLDPDPEHDTNRGAYLLGKAVDVAERAPWSPAKTLAVDLKAGIAASTLYAQLKAFFTDCADVLALTDTKSASRLAAASTHWLRHTHGSHAIAAGMPLDVLQENFGHASLDTTTIYTTSEQRRRMRAAEMFWEKKSRRI
ncbi:int, tyrosine-based site-specific recombinase [Herbaspirillum sp. HC18]|nr:int, tyrosine-based site-specific recombinase [Herbaspirillum sp. HC18]